MQRHVLSEKESVEIKEKVKEKYNIDLDSQLEIGKEKKAKYYLVNHILAFFVMNDEIVPTLCGVIKLKINMPYVAVDEGAVKALIKGADLFTPGIKEYHCEVKPNSIVLVRTLQGLPVALMRISEGAEEAVKAGKGKFGVNVHHLNDELWGLCNGKN